MKIRKKGKKNILKRRYQWIVDVYHKQFKSRQISNKSKTKKNLKEKILMQSFYKVLSIKNYEIYKETKKYKLFSGKKESIRTD